MHPHPTRKTAADRLLPIVADSWAKLRAVDLWRLLDAADQIGKLASVARVVAERRPDLADTVRELETEFACVD